MLEFKIGDKVFPLSTKLRVAYALQSENKHKPYMQILQSMGAATLDEQLGFIYLSAKIENPDLPKEISLPAFKDYVLDNGNLDALLDTCTSLIQGLMFNGLSAEEIVEKKSQKTKK